MKDTVLSTNIISILKIKRLRHRELKQLAQGHEASGSPPLPPCTIETSSDTTVNDVIKSVSFGIMMGIIGIFFLRRENMIL